MAASEQYRRRNANTRWSKAKVEKNLGCFVCKFCICQPRERGRRIQKFCCGRLRGASRALQTSECNELLDPTRASCLICPAPASKFDNGWQTACSKVVLNIRDRTFCFNAFGPKSIKNCEKTHRINSTGIGVVFN